MNNITQLKDHLSKIITIWVSGVASNCQNTIIVTVEFAYDPVFDTQ